MLRLADRLDMTTAVAWDVKPKIKHCKLILDFNLKITNNGQSEQKERFHWSKNVHSGQVQKFYLLVLGQVKILQLCISYLVIIMNTRRVENNVDPDHMASSEAS